MSLKKLDTKLFCVHINSLLRELFYESEKGNYFENIQHTIFSYIFIWVRKLDSSSFTKKKNLRGRNEVTQASGRLHPL